MQQLVTLFCHINENLHLSQAKITSLNVSDLAVHSISIWPNKQLQSCPSQTHPESSTVKVMRKQSLSMLLIAQDTYCLTNNMRL